MAVAAALLVAGSNAWAVQRAAAPVDARGIWDLEWVTKRGPRRSGWFDISQDSSGIVVAMHGRGQVRARGTLSGRRLAVRGSRMMVPYRIDADIEGDRMSGAFRVLGRERRFIGYRRR